MGGYNSILVALMLFIAVVSNTDGVLAGSGCDADSKKVDNFCRSYVTKNFNPFKKEKLIQPSSDCCDSLKRAGHECLSSKVSKNVCFFVSEKRVRYVAKECGIPIPDGCGFRWVFL